MATERLFDRDVQMLTFTATVIACRAVQSGYEVVLDRTAFFPEGGGQGADHGTLNGAAVTDCRDRGGEIVHHVDRPLREGETAEGCVDGERRLSMMQQHSGEHVFSGIVHALYGYDNVGFHIGSDAVTMDFNGLLTEEDVRKVERLANEAIWKDLPVKAYYPEREELQAMTYRSKKAIAGDVRIVSIEGIDTCACCGTHVTHTGSIGQIKVIGVMKYKGGVRVSVLCGMRALRMENGMLEQVKQIAGKLSAKPEGIAEAVEKVRQERDALRARNEELGMRLFAVQAEREAEKAIRVVVCEEIAPGQAAKAAGLLGSGAAAALVLIPTGDGWRFALTGRADMRIAAKALCEAFGGRGGGQASLVQGQLGKADEQTIREKLIDVMN